MNDTMIYRPGRSCAWFVPFMLSSGIFCFVMLGAGIFSFVAEGYSLTDIGPLFFFLLGMGIISIVLTKVLYDCSNIMVLFEEEGLRVTGGKYNNYWYALWKEFPYAYYARNYKGFLFLVLSPKALSQKEAKRFANRGSNSMRICVDYVAVIPMDNQQIQKVKNFLESKELHIDTYLPSR